MSKPNANAKLSQSLKALLRENLLWIEKEQQRLLQDSPFANAGQAEIRLFAALRGESKTIAELSRYLGISRQAAHQTVHKLIGHGVVELQPMKDNRREKMVAITERGQMARSLTAKHFRQIEAKVAKKIGKSELQQLKQLLESNLE
ncbi:MAG: MarR family winged helix-turn-helix transcriptional regulator [Pseudomonadales bacterium]|nr:MarR family winged helix-turn-helix transcriptional regulator [Pseudomonadales bacterium]